MDNDAPSSPDNKSSRGRKTVEDIKSIGKFWAELKRRKVMRVAVTYAVVGWLLIQVAISVFPQVGLPEWAPALVTWFLILGFPIALIFAWAFQLTAEGIKAEEEVLPGQVIVREKGQKLHYVTVGLVVLVLTFLIVDRYVLSPTLTLTTTGGASSSMSSVQLAVTFDPGQIAPTGFGKVLSLSSDGKRLAYTIEENGVRRLYIRSIDNVNPSLVGNEEAFEHFFSLDGEWIYFFDGINGKVLRKAPVDGGPSLEVAVFGGDMRGACWAADGSLILGGQAGLGLQKLHVDGRIEKLTTPLERQGDSYPQVLPDGRILYTSQEDKPNTGTLKVLIPETKQVIELVKGTAGRYLDTGHLLYLHEHTL